MAHLHRKKKKKKIKKKINGVVKGRHFNPTAKLSVIIKNT